ncbi:MAG: phospho-N-acetylmuramoyl-pentapeptide-transferase [Phycisphaerae bacterium]|nr:phospho-N-acetylmuramoyl-pentapeptide-transferase [Phycisphaerae bacterium]
MIFLLFDLAREWLASVGLYRYLQILDQVEFRALAAAILAFALVLAAGKPVIAWLRRKKIGDTGQTDSEALRRSAQSKAATPTMGGILIVGAILIASGLLADLSNRYVIMALIVTLWLAALGGIDDWLKLTAASRPGGSRQGLYAWEKLVFQLGLGLLIGYFTFRQGSTEAALDLPHVLNLPFQKTYESGIGTVVDGLWYLPQWLFVLIALLMVTGMSNAVNITDGMDGLATGVSAAVGLGIMVLAIIAGVLKYAQPMLTPHVPTSEELGVVTGSLVGACLGFLWFNCAPAQVFMGDTGSLALGGLLGYVAVVIRQEFLLLLMSLVFIIEIASVVIQVGFFKLSGGKRVFRCAPFHHHLHLGGWTEQQVVIRFWVISILMMVSALAVLKMR